MSATPSRHRWSRRLRPDPEGGFGLVEVMVAFAIFSLVGTATLGVIVTALRSTGVARLDTVGRNVVQAQLEQMRALPYQAPAGPTFLTSYYPDINGTGAAIGTAGYVPAGAPRDVATGDPPAGAFYRTMVASVPGQSSFSLSVAAQLLSATGVPVTPPAAYDPRTTEVGTLTAVFATAHWTYFGAPHTYTVRTEIPAARALPERVLLQGRMTALRISGGIDTLRKITMSAGGLVLDGSLVQDGAASVSATGITTTVTDGLRADGATATVSAPPDSSVASATDPGGSYAYTYNGVSNAMATYGPSAVGGGPVTGSYQTPQAGTSSQPVTSSLSFPSSGTAFGLTNQVSGDSTDPKLQLLAGPLVLSGAQSCAPTCPAAQGTGWLGSTDNATQHGASASLSATTQTVALLPTSFAPQGLVQLSLTSAALACSSSGTYGGSTTSTASETYTGSLRYWNSTGYTTVALSSSQDSSPLTPELLNTQVGTYTDTSVTPSVPTPLYLKDYLSSWGSATTGSLASAVQVRPGGQSVSMSVDGLIYVNTVSLRPAAPGVSGLGVQLGSGSCLAQDVR